MAAGLDRVEQLDHRADSGLVDLLAAAARIVPERLRALRVTLDDGTATCWHRVTAITRPLAPRGGYRWSRPSLVRVLRYCKLCED